MRILVHDFGGYAFPLQLSRTLAGRGHEVCHAYCSSLTTTPPGVRQSATPFTLQPLQTNKPFDKYNLVRRWQQENEYGRLVTDLCKKFQPDVVLSGNTPLPAQKALIKECRRNGIDFVFWLQDLIGLAAFRILKSKQWILGETVGRYFNRLERHLLRSSDAVVCISDDFVPLLENMGVPGDQIQVVENWGVLQKATGQRKDWARSMGLDDRPIFLYTGTLSLKHNPESLADLARATGDAAHVVVISQGMGADWLESQQEKGRLGNLTVLPYQRSKDLPDIYASADVLIALLTDDAGVFSVPSKVLTYLCAGRPILAAMPPDNLAARIIAREGAGLVTSSGDKETFVQQATILMGDKELRTRMGNAAKACADRRFDIEKITDRFEDVFSTVQA